MNPEHDPDLAEAARSQLHPVLAAAISAEQTPPQVLAAAEQPAAERSMLAVHRDPSLIGRDRAAHSAAADAEPLEPEPGADAEARRPTQVRWVRPTDLAMQAGARATGWGLDLRAELGQRFLDSRTARKEQRPGSRDERASRLPDMSILGRRRQARHEPARAGMGLR